jgi:hypothetical protein
MPRPVSWLPRLHQIRQSVANSVRSHYTSRDLAQLFQLQPRAARDLLAILVTDEVGRSGLVTREVLQEFLDQAKAADDVSALCIARRAGKVAVSRKKPRNLVRRDFEPGTLATLPLWIKLELGRLEIRFTSSEHLVDSLWRMAAVFQDDAECDKFSALYVPAQPIKKKDGAEDEVRGMFAELEELEAAHGR